VRQSGSDNTARAGDLAACSAVAFDMRIRHVEEGGMDPVSGRQAVGEIRRDLHDASTYRLHTPQQRYAISGEAAKVDGVAAIAPVITGSNREGSRCSPASDRCPWR